MIRRFTLFLQIKLANGSISHLIDENGSFRFIENDILKVGPRVKHNIYIKDYAEARALSYRLQNVSNDYQKQVLKDKPSIYWLLSERRGSTVAHNSHGSCLSLSCCKYCTWYCPHTMRPQGRRVLN